MSDTLNKKLAPLQRNNSIERVQRQQKMTSQIKQQSLLSRILNQGLIQTGPYPDLDLFQKYSPDSKNKTP
jgi:hypothetical protein